MYRFIKGEESFNIFGVGVNLAGTFLDTHCIFQPLG